MLSGIKCFEAELRCWPGFLGIMCFEVELRCWPGLSRIKCFEAKLRCWPGLSGIKCFVAVEAKLKTGVPNYSMLKGMHIAYYEIIV